MKKIVSLLLTFALLCTALFAFASCGEESLDKAYNKALEKVKAPTGKEKTLVVATSPDFAPMEFYDAAKKGNDAIVGFDILLANFLAKELDMNLVIKPMSFDATQAACETGNVDLAISGFSWTEERAENYEISDWYIAGDNETEQAIITTKKYENKLTTVASFEGLTIGFQDASLQKDLTEKNFGEMEKAGKVHFATYTDLGTAVEAMKAGKIDALAVAKGNGDAMIANAADTLAFTGFLFEIDAKQENNVVLLQKGNTELLAKVNAALAKAKSAGYYGEWYEACQVYSGTKTLDELGYDDQGNKITEPAE